jgi:hypothetical protein
VADAADMGRYGSIRVDVWNAYNSLCSTLWYSGSGGFQQGDKFNTNDCDGFIMPNKVISLDVQKS